MKRILPFLLLFILIVGVSGCDSDKPPPPPDPVEIADQIRLHVWWADGATMDTEILIDVNKRVWNTYVDEVNWTEYFSKPLSIRIIGDRVTIEMRQPEPGTGSKFKVIAYWHPLGDGMVGSITDFAREEDEQDRRGRIVGFPLN